jgi:hypothetical protein
VVSLAYLHCHQTAYSFSSPTLIVSFLCDSQPAYHDLHMRFEFDCINCQCKCELMQAIGQKAKMEVLRPRETGMERPSHLVEEYM